MTEQRNFTQLKKTAAFPAAVLFSFLIIIYVIITKEKVTRKDFISKFHKIQTGESTRNLKIVFGKPHVFYGKDVCLIFPGSADSKNSTYIVYRFSTGGLFIPLVCDFLIENDAVCKKKLSD